MSKNRVILLISLLIVVALTSALVLILRPIKIGVIIPTNSALGSEENMYTRFFTDKHPRIGLRPIKLIIENQADDEDETKAAYKDMAEQGASIIVGGVTSQDGVWIAEMAKEMQIPTFGITSSSSLLSSKKDYFYRLVPTNDIQARVVAEYYNRLNCKRLVILTPVDNTPYSDPYKKVLQEYFNGESIDIPYKNDEDTYKKILEYQPDSIFCILKAKDVIELINKIKENHPEITIGSSSWGSAEILSLYSSPLLDGVLLFQSNDKVINPDFEPEIKEFEKMYSLKATKGAHYTASVFDTIFQGLREAGSSRADLIDYFDTPRNYDTTYGEAFMDEFGDTKIDMIILLQTSGGQVTNRLELSAGE